MKADQADRLDRAGRGDRAGRRDRAGTAGVRHNGDTTTTDAAARDTRWRVEGMLGRTRRDTVATAWRLRRQLLPHAVTTIVLGGGLAAHAITAAGATTPAQASALLAVSTTPLAWLVTKVMRKRRKAWAGRTLAGGVAAAAWLAAAPHAMGPEQIAALLSLELAIAGRWWKANRLGYPTPEGADDLDVAGVSVPGQIIADWATYVAAKGKALPGSRLDFVERTRHGWAFDLLLDRGSQGLSTAIAALEKIAGGLDREIADLIIESHPILRSPARCRFQVVTDSPIKGEVTFDGPRRVGDPGRALLELGPYADGSGEALYRLYTPGSMWSGVIIGGTGIGKSRVVENIVISALSGGDTEFWYLDPQRGVSSPALARHADWFATMDDADAMLDAALAILDGRGEEASYEGWTGFTPTPERPGLLIVVEECHNPFANPEKAKKWAKLAREGRKVGIALLVVSQYPGLETFGGTEALRSSIMEGNALVLRSTSNSTGQLMAGLQVNPKTLPKIPGYAYVQGSEETGIRTAPFRNRDTGNNAADWLAAQPRPGLETLAVTATLAAGSAYTERHTSSEGGRAASAARVEALRSGHLPADMFAGRHQETSTAGIGEFGTIIRFPHRFVWQHEPAVPDTIPPTLSGAVDAAVDAAVGGVHEAAHPHHRYAAAARAGAAAALSVSHRAVLDAVRGGATRPVEVQATVGLGHRQTAALLRDLVMAGYLTQPKYGRYQLAGDRAVVLSRQDGQLRKEA